MVDAKRPDNGSGLRSRTVAIITCHDRLEHLRVTLPLVAPAFKVIVVDYGCPQRSSEWVEWFAHTGGWPSVRARRFESDPAGPAFWKPRALNHGAKVATDEFGADRLLFLDADTMVEGPHKLAAELAELEPDQFAMAGRLHGYDDAGLTGALSCSASAFRSVGGFDLIYRGWGMEDVDMRLELATDGGRPHWIKRGLLRALKHADDLRTKHRAPGVLAQRSYHISRGAFLSKWSERLGLELQNVKELPPELRALCFHNRTIGGVYA